ncbi:MAG: flagellar hook-length control protein FliK [Rhodovulum sp.]|jgi:flagellar hook-length control protein FliK|nr:hypothetical protein [Rhodovulum sp.]MCI5086616.1 flagellar hook-length control protein FliK [Rhodovulum sp.]
MTSVSLGEGGLGTTGHLSMGTQKVPGENPLFAALFATLSPDQAAEGADGDLPSLDQIKDTLGEGEVVECLPVLDLAALNLPADAEPAQILAAVMQAVKTGDMPVEGEMPALELTGDPETDAGVVTDVLTQIGLRLTGQEVPVQTHITVPGETVETTPQQGGDDITDILTLQAGPIAALPAQGLPVETVTTAPDTGIRTAISTASAAPALPVAQMVVQQTRTPTATAAPTATVAVDAPVIETPQFRVAPTAPVAAVTESDLAPEGIAPVTNAPRVAEVALKSTTAQAPSVDITPAVLTDAPEGTLPFAPANPQIVNDPAAMAKTADARVEAPLDMTSPTWTDSLIEDIQMQAADGAEQIDMTLTPERLGRLQIQIEMRDGAANIRIITETAEAARLLNDAQGRLSEMMERAGMDLAGHTAGQQGDARGQRDQTGPEGPTPSAAQRGDDIDTSDTTPPPRTGASGSGVDLLA